MATGLTIAAAVRAVNRHRPKRIVVTVPVASPDSVDRIQPLVETIIILNDPQTFRGAVGAHYQIFNQVGDEEVRSLLREVRNDLQQAAAHSTSSAPGSALSPISHHARRPRHVRHSGARPGSGAGVSDALPRDTDLLQPSRLHDPLRRAGSTRRTGARNAGRAVT